MHAVRNLFIRVVDMLGVSALYRTWVKRSGSLIRIVVFHDVHDRVWFASLIEQLAQECNILTPEDFSVGRFDTERVNVLITFDDGYESWVSQVLPVLTELRVKGLFFVNSGLLDSAHDAEKTAAFMHDELHVRPRKPITWDGARELVRTGHTIGSHAYHHVDLTKRTHDEVLSLFLKDKERIEAELGTTVTECAYPFGTLFHVNDTVKKAAQNAGFLRGYTAISRFVPPDETFGVPRMCIESSATPDSLMWWVRGGYDLFDMVKQLCVR